MVDTGLSCLALEGGSENSIWEQHSVDVFGIKETESLLSPTFIASETWNPWRLKYGFPTKITSSLLVLKDEAPECPEITTRQR